MCLTYKVPSGYYWAVCGQMTSSLCRCLNQILIQYLILIWKKLNATSNPFEAEPTTEAFGALDDMAWLNGLQVKSCSRDCDIIRRRRTRTPRVLGRTDRQWNAFFRKVRTESRTENTDKIRKVDIDRHRQEFSGNLDKNETRAGLRKCCPLMSDHKNVI